MNFIIALAAVVICTIHITILWRFHSLTTHTARLASLIFFICAPIVFALAMLVAFTFVEWGARDLWNSLEELMGLIGIVYGVLLLAVPVFLAFSVPGNFISFTLLLMLYVSYVFATLSAPGFSGVCIIISLLVAGWFPWHRRLVEYCRPPKLPQLPKYRPPEKPPALLAFPPAGGPPPLASSRGRGVTLIELLIVVVIIAIFTVAVINATMIAYRAELHQRRRSQAIALAEDQFALLRARDALPEIGTHPIDEELAAKCPVDAEARITIFPGPNERLREVFVTVDLKGAEDQRTVSLATIMPARREGGRAP